MFEWLSSMENTKPLALVIFLVSFVGVLIYVLTNRKRSERLESYKNIPFLDDDEASEKGSNVDKDSDNG